MPIKNELEIVLMELFKRVGREYDEEMIKKECWFMENEWSAEQEIEFCDWFVQHLYDNKDARDALMRFPSRSKKKIRAFVDEFVLNYGWKLKR